MTVEGNLYYKSFLLTGARESKEIYLIYFHAYSSASKAFSQIPIQFKLSFFTMLTLHFVQANLDSYRPLFAVKSDNKAALSAIIREELQRVNG